MMTVIGLVGGLVLLVLGAEALVRGASSLAARLGVSALAIGLTVVAFGTSAPELAVSVGGALTGVGDVAIGNVVGSNVFNLLAILGASALASALVVKRRIVRLDVPILVGVTALVWLLAWAGGALGRVDGALLVAGMLAYTLWVYRASRGSADAEGIETGGRLRRWPLAVLAVAGGLAALVAGARLLVDAATRIAAAAGVDDLTIGLTVVAAGTSLPELATSLVAAVRGQRDIAVGNVVGSNIFNLLAVLGAAALAAPGGLPVAAEVLGTDLPMSLVATLVVLPALVTGLVIARWEGALLLGGYAGYLAVVVLTGTQSPLAASARLALYGALAGVAVLTVVVGRRSRA